MVVVSALQYSQIIYLSYQSNDVGVADLKLTEDRGWETKYTIVGIPSTDTSIIDMNVIISRELTIPYEMN